jgi:hypothetical protein
MNERPRVTVSQEGLIVQVLDKTSPTIEINPDATYVTVDASEKPQVHVYLGGSRGPMFVPGGGGSWDGTGLAAILAGAITKQQLSLDLTATIEESETGLLEARADLDGAIQTLAATGVLVDTTVSRVDVAEAEIVSQVARLNAAEGNITNSQVLLNDKEIRLSVAEQSLENHENYIVTQEHILSNSWNIKIQENTDGTAYVAGVGLLVYPNWELSQIYDIGDFVWFDDHAYQAKLTHTSIEANHPPNNSYWQLIPYAAKSQFGVLADSFFVQTVVDGEPYVPFMIYGDQVIINGDMMVNGLLTVQSLLAAEIFSFTIESINYVPGISGYKLNSLTGVAEFNDFTIELNHNIIGPNLVPNSDFRDVSSVDWTIYANPESGVVDVDIFNGYNLIDADGIGWDQYRLAFANVLTIKRISTSACANNYFELISNDYIEVQPYTKYAFFAYVLGWLNQMRIDIIFYDSSYQVIDRIQGNTVDPKASMLSALDLNSWEKSGAIVTSPQYAIYCKFVIRAGSGTVPLTTNLYLQTTYFYLGKVNASTTELPSWVLDTQDAYAAINQRALDTTMDTQTGGIIVRDGGNRRYAHLTGGDITFYDYYGGAYHAYKSLKKSVHGVCIDGEAVNIGYFRTQPSIILSPKSLEVYNPSYNNQLQKFVLDVLNVRKSGDNWFFDAKCQLVVSANSGSIGAQSIHSVALPPTDAGATVSVYTDAISFPASVKSVTLNANIWTAYFRFISSLNSEKLATVYATCTLQVYMLDAWYSVTEFHTGAHTPALGAYFNTNLGYTSGNNITYARLLLTVTKDISYNVQRPETTSMFTQSVQIAGSSYYMAGAVLSLNGQANYMATGG